MPTEILTSVYRHLDEHGDFFALAHLSGRMPAIAREPTVLQTHLQQNGVAVPASRSTAELWRALCASAKGPTGVYRLTTSALRSAPAASPPPVASPPPPSLPANARFLAASEDGRWIVGLVERAPPSRGAR
ncbi:MAG TPA: hypothetical protein VFH51_09630 [Myxococcota bacterium]|nr:hypothetical protein [Myxococcota bacterium]